MNRSRVNNNNIKALKSGVWYTIANIIIKGLGLLTTPVFTRLLTHEEFGLYSNYFSWLNVFSYVITLNLAATFISARYDFEDDFDGYISSMLSLSILSSIIWSLLINLFPSWFANITNLNIKYLLFTAAIDMFLARERYYFEYKISVLISVFLSVFSSLLAVLLVLHMEDKLTGRIVGFAITHILIGLALVLLIFYYGRSVQFFYWKYALPICIPFIPHLLSLTMLNSMDKIMITQICGAEFNALYSLAYSCGAVITLVTTSLNTAFSPWLGEQLHRKNYTKIKEVAVQYVLLFIFLTSGIMLVVPEFLLIMGGSSYQSAIYVMPPVAFGCVCQFIYTMHVNIEQFNLKTVGMAIASISAAALNYVLNFIFIPKYGYIAAAYTTLASFLWLMLIHMYLVYKIGFAHVYNWKFNLEIIIIFAMYTVLINILYGIPVLRYTAIGIYWFVFMFLFYKHKANLKILLK